LPQEVRDIVYDNVRIAGTYSGKEIVPTAQGLKEFFRKQFDGRHAEIKARNAEQIAQTSVGVQYQPVAAQGREMSTQATSFEYAPNESDMATRLQAAYRGHASRRGAIPEQVQESPEVGSPEDLEQLRQMRAVAQRISAGQAPPSHAPSDSSAESLEDVAAPLPRTQRRASFTVPPVRGDRDSTRVGKQIGRLIDSIGKIGAIKKTLGYEEDPARVGRNMQKQFARIVGDGKDLDPETFYEAVAKEAPAGFDEVDHTVEDVRQRFTQLIKAQVEAARGPHDMPVDPGAYERALRTNSFLQQMEQVVPDVAPATLRLEKMRDKSSNQVELQDSFSDATWANYMNDAKRRTDKKERNAVDEEIPLKEWEFERDSRDSFTVSRHPGHEKKESRVTVERLGELPPEGTSFGAQPEKRLRITGSGVKDGGDPQVLQIVAQAQRIARQQGNKVCLISKGNAVTAIKIYKALKHVGLEAEFTPKVEARVRQYIKEKKEGPRPQRSGQNRGS
jgi:hypothetical protein